MCIVAIDLASPPFEIEGVLMSEAAQDVMICAGYMDDSARKQLITAKALERQISEDEARVLLSALGLLSE